MWHKYFPPVYNSYFSVEDLGCKIVFLQGYRRPCSVNPERNACRDNPFPKIICLDWSRQFQERNYRSSCSTQSCNNFLILKPSTPPRNGQSQLLPPGRPSQKRGYPSLCMLIITALSAEGQTSTAFCCLRNLTCFAMLLVFWDIKMTLDFCK